MPEPYAPPVQRQPLEEFRPYRATRIVNMADGDAPGYFVQDISADLNASWRWAGKHPTVRLRPRTNEGLKYVIDFTLPDITFKDTGPVTLSFFVNDHLLDKIRYAEPGYKHFEKAVPADWVSAAQDTLVAAEIDQMWVSKLDGAKFGFILTSIGLTQQPAQP
jgi:hypothetical protein